MKESCLRLSFLWHYWSWTTFANVIIKIRVITQTAAVSIQKQDGTQTQKCSLVLQELGGKYENSIVATMLGNMASLKFYQNDIVAASLRFSHREYNGQYYMDCTVRDIIKINTSNAF